MFRLWHWLFGWDYVLLPNGQILRVHAPWCRVHHTFGCPYVEPRDRVAGCTKDGKLYLTGQERDIAWLTCDPWDYRRLFNPCSHTATVEHCEPAHECTEPGENNVCTRGSCGDPDVQAVPSRGRPAVADSVRSNPALKYCAYPVCRCTLTESAVCPRGLLDFPGIPDVEYKHAAVRRKFHKPQ